MRLNIANGTFFKHKLEFKEQAKIISQLNVDGIELTFRYIDELDSCLKNNKFLDFLSRFKYNTIHSPFGKKPKIKIYREDSIDEILIKLKKIAERINAKNIVFHPYNFEDLSLLNKINNKLFSIENTITENMNANQLSQLLDEYQNLGFTIDTSHATFIGKKEFDDLFDKLRNRIKTIHFSNAWNEEQHKQFFSMNGINRFSKLLTLNNEIILTIEENFNEDLIDSINKEILFVRKWVKGN